MQSTDLKRIFVFAVEIHYYSFLTLAFVALFIIEFLYSVRVKDIFVFAFGCYEQLLSVSKSILRN